MNNKCFTRRLCAALGCFLFLALLPAFTMPLSSPTWKYDIDLPDDYELTDKGSNRYLFSSTVLPTDILVSAYPSSRGKNAAAILSDILTQLAGTGEIAEIPWRNRDCAVSQISMNFAGTPQNGWGVCAELPQETGFILMLGYYPAGSNDEMMCETSIISALDSLCTDLGALCEAGPLTAFAYPSEGDIEVTTTIRNVPICALMDKSDAEANQYVIEREYTLLRFESDHGFGEEACKRFYRMVFRDAGKRLRRFSFAVQNELASGLSTKEERFALAETIVQWTQVFPYTRDLLGSDFASLPALAADSDAKDSAGGDCDSRALLAALMLRQMNYNTILCVSSVYSHALVGIALDGDGSHIELDGVSYLLGETTKRAPLGTIDRAISDMTKWMPVNFY